MTGMVTARYRLLQANDLAAALGAAREAFEVILAAIRSHEDPASGLFTSLVMAGSWAADGQDNVVRQTARSTIG
jgi:hypothetical protein